MSALGEKTLIAHLVDPDAVAIIAKDGIASDMLPTAELRPVLTFAIDYYFGSGCQKAPSVAVMRAEYGDTLDDAEIDIETEPEDSVEWALDDLKATWVHRKASFFNKEFATAMAEAPKDERVDVLNAFATQLVSMGLSMESREYRAEIRDIAPSIIRRYESRVASKGEFRGMGLGLPEVDRHTYGIHEGELAIAAAGPKTGKSNLLCWTGLREFQRGRNVVLFTLENSVEMMIDRIACMAMAVDTQVWERGEATEAEVDRVKLWVEDIALSDEGQNRLHIHKPDLGQRSFEHMVREAQLLGCESLLVDQLTHVEVNRGDNDHRPRHEKIGSALHLLKAMISSGRHPMPCLLAHQINRDGMKAADKLGYLDMQFLAEASECERTADMIFGLYASKDEKAVRQAKFQILGARRLPPKHWQIKWRPEIGQIKTTQEIEIE